MEKRLLNSITQEEARQILDAAFLHQPGELWYMISIDEESGNDLVFIYTKWLNLSLRQDGRIIGYYASSGKSDTNPLPPGLIITPNEKQIRETLTKLNISFSII